MHVWGPSPQKFNIERCNSLHLWAFIVSTFPPHFVSIGTVDSEKVRVTDTELVLMRFR